MALFVHVTAERIAQRVRRTGLKALSAAPPLKARVSSDSVDRLARLGGRGVYAFPRVESYLLTHQWVREIARFHVRQPLVVVTFRIPDDELVAVGHYAHPARPCSAAEAAAAVCRLDDARGWEVFVPRGITAGEIRRIRPAPRSTGWRYSPDAHGTAPCTCEGCAPYGTYGAARLRERRPHPMDGPFGPRNVLLTQLADAAAAGHHAVVAELIRKIGRGNGRQRWHGPIRELSAYATYPDVAVRHELVYTVAHWRTPGVDDLLTRLAADVHLGVRESAAWVLSKRPHWSS
ncbi:hypothetical protein ABI214_14755 [Prescottella soli]|uniref:AbiEi antitoxin C-terminal domain-containing protein n=1 Tax=Prescottella soli TaxID=1543852 RepID=A0ABW9FWI2_9NOCA